MVGLSVTSGAVDICPFCSSEDIAWNSDNDWWDCHNCGEYFDYPAKTGYNLTLTGCTAIVDSQSVTSADEGASVTITANIPENMLFDGWTVSGIEIQNTTDNPLTFTMPSNEVSVTANLSEDTRLDLSDAEIIVNTSESTITVTLNGEIVPSTAYNVLYMWYEKTEEGNILKDMFDYFPPEHGNYAIFIIAVDGSGYKNLNFIDTTIEDDPSRYRQDTPIGGGFADIPNTQATRTQVLLPLPLPRLLRLIQLPEQEPTIQLLPAYSSM